jgi:hypothetical protein
VKFRESAGLLRQDVVPFHRCEDLVHSYCSELPQCAMILTPCKGSLTWPAIVDRKGTPVLLMAISTLMIPTDCLLSSLCTEISSHCAFGCFQRPLCLFSRMMMSSCSWTRMWRLSVAVSRSPPQWRTNRHIHQLVTTTSKRSMTRITACHSCRQSSSRAHDLNGVMTAASACISISCCLRRKRTDFRW